MAPRRKNSARAEIESDVLDSPRWSGLRQQQRLQQQNQTPEENARARIACRQLVVGGYGPMRNTWRGLDVHSRN